MAPSDYRESERKRPKERKWGRGARWWGRGAREQQQWGGPGLSNPSRHISTSSLQHGRAPHRSLAAATPTLYSRAQPLHLTKMTIRTVLEAIGWESCQASVDEGKLSRKYLCSSLTRARRNMEAGGASIQWTELPRAL
ncbi:hypothetical protein Pmani_013549 [Petrolisthes manimaculis]|uniref:Uncharacterized protein n=1 Tax=Petrolisthes manimaculis TaxID=1843537 RepID=A0AAE1PW77_9EUCA|nr:hypothetical protein Pmani_013549 [Petrolisthes manimaculis]